jgi:hypothetical protein
MQSGNVLLTTTGFDARPRKIEATQSPIAKEIVLVPQSFSLFLQ